jgi:hypothetical protein
MTTITERVAAGAAYLDEREPGWWQRVDIRTFDITSPCKCILGQVYRAAVRVVAGAGGFDYADGYLGVDIEHLGFDVRPGGEIRYPELEAEWKRVIEQRRAVS